MGGHIKKRAILRNTPTDKNKHPTDKIKHPTDNKQLIVGSGARVMPPKMTGFAWSQQAAKEGLAKMSSFFKPEKKSGRPEKKKAGGRPSAAQHELSGVVAPAPEASAPVASEPAAKKSRANYNVPGPAKEKMDAAVEAWVNEKRPEDIATTSGVASTYDFDALEASAYNDIEEEEEDFREEEEEEGSGSCDESESDGESEMGRGMRVKIKCTRLGEEESDGD